MDAITIEKNEAYLRQVSKDANIHDERTKYEISVLEKFCMNHDVMAMAAVQIGIPKRIIYLKNTNLDVINRKNEGTSTLDDNNYNERRVLINPIIVEQYGLTEYWEACASCLDYCGKVLRPYLMLVNYIDENNEVKEEWFEGFEATVLSHELDHLDGILHMDKAYDSVIIPQEYRMNLRQAEPYHIMSTYDEYEDLVAGFKPKRKTLR